MLKFECERCKHIFTENEITPVLFFAATRDEPDEFVDHCPECHSDKIIEMPTIFCEGCGNEPVQDERERCTECRTCEAEERMAI